MKEINVLVLDDEQNILNSLKRMFVGEAFEVFVTTKPEKAFEALAKNKIKVVMSDQRMPAISGVKFLREVKEGYPDTIRILFTGYADIKVAEDAINKGEVYRFINKPWEDAELKTTIRDAIEKYDLRQHNKELMQETTRQNEELKDLNFKLKNMYEAQKAFSSTVSHELRTPLALIKAGLEVVLSETPGKINDDQKNFLKKSHSHVERLNRLIDDILDLNKLESGRARLEIKNNHINKAIKEIAELQKQVAEKKGLYFKLEMDEGIPQIPFDLDKINQVLVNLVNNAFKFTEKGGVIVKSELHKEGNHVQVSVKDTGPGIKKDDMDKLFKKFQQLGDPAKRKTGGTGLGLAICQEIIRQHNGKIWVESKEQEGTSFIFLLPIVERRKG